MRRISPKHAALLALMIPLMVAGNCPQNRFEVVMQAAPDGRVERELTLWVQDGDEVKPPPPEMLAQAQKTHGGEGRTVANKQRFGSTVRTELPGDLQHEALTNRGLFVRETANIGTLAMYSERMPGQPNLAVVLRAAEQYADTLTRALAAEMRARPELAAKPDNLEACARLIETEGRDDVTGALLLGWQFMTRSAALTDAGIEIEGGDKPTPFLYGEGLRLADYLIERGYLKADEVRPVPQAMGDVIKHGVLRKVAVALGHPAEGPWPAALREIGEKPEDFLDAGLTRIGVEKEAFDKLIEPAAPAILGNPPKGTVVWRGATAPLYTNGKWAETEKEVRWDARARVGCETPQVLFAIWAEPDEGFQREHFGAVVVRDHELYEYLNWRGGLSATERAAWDSFVADCRPGPDLIARLQAFRLPQDATTTQPATSQPSAPTTSATTQPDGIVRGAELIIQGLKPAKESETDAK